MIFRDEKNFSGSRRQENMKLIGIFLLSTLFVPQPSWAEEATVTLETGRLRVEILPESSGRVVSLYDKQDQIEHFEKLEERVDAFSPLVPPWIESNQAGLKDWFWKKRNPVRTEFELTGKGESEIGPWAKVVGKVGTVEVERRVTLLKSAPAVRIDLRLRSATKQTVSYWMHAVIAHHIYLDPKTDKGWIAGVFSQETTPHQGRAMFRVPKPGVQKMETGFGDYAFVPAGHWFARIAPGRPLALVVVTKKSFIGSEGFFYTWQDPQTRIMSLETIWPPAEIGPKEETHLRFFLVLVAASDPPKIAEAVEQFYQTVNWDAP